MKKTILIAISAVAVMSIAACRKDRTCTCTTTYSSNQPGFSQPAETSVNKLTKIKKKNATLYCTSSTDVSTQSGYTYTSTHTCDLK
jgi:hypothetical protein